MPNGCCKEFTLHWYQINKIYAIWIQQTHPVAGVFFSFVFVNEWEQSSHGIDKIPINIIFDRIQQEVSIDMKIFCKCCFTLPNWVRERERKSLKGNIELICPKMDTFVNGFDGIFKSDSMRF